MCSVGDRGDPQETASGGPAFQVQLAIPDMGSPAPVEDFAAPPDVQRCRQGEEQAEHAHRHGRAIQSHNQELEGEDGMPIRPLSPLRPRPPR